MTSNAKTLKHFSLSYIPSEFTNALLLSPIVDSPARNFDEHDLSYEEWKSVLDLSTRWGFASLRKLALRLIKLPTAFDQLLLARTYSVDHWVLPALSALCERTRPTNLKEARQMSIEDVVLVATVREEIRRKKRPFFDTTGIQRLIEVAQIRMAAHVASDDFAPDDTPNSSENEVAEKVHPYPGSVCEQGPLGGLLPGCPPSGLFPGAPPRAPPGAPSGASQRLRASGARIPTALDAARVAKGSENSDDVPELEALGGDGPIDETGVDSKEIEIVMAQVRCTRAKAVRVLKENGGDLINASLSILSFASVTPPLIYCSRQLWRRASDSLSDGWHCISVNSSFINVLPLGFPQLCDPPSAPPNALPGAPSGAHTIQALGDLHDSAINYCTSHSYALMINKNNCIGSCINAPLRYRQSCTEKQTSVLVTGRNRHPEALTFQFPCGGYYEGNKGNDP